MVETKEKIMDYEKSESIAVDAIKKQIPKEFKSNEVKLGGSFVDLFQNDRVHPNFYSFTAIDGAGSKALISQLMNEYRTIGIDCVAMSANDAATLSPIEPFLYMDYLACQRKIEEEKAGHIIEGIITGLRECDVSKVYHHVAPINMAKGETASLDEMIGGIVPGYGFDIAGAMIGYIEKKKIMNINSKPGNKIIGLKSSGLHSNGYTGARHILLDGDFELRPQFKVEYEGQYSVDDKPIEGRKLGDILLEPTKIYVKPMAAIASEVPEVIGINITGYGLKNFNRVGENVIYDIIDSIEPQPIFKLIEKESGFSLEEMYTKFNMGMGFAIIVPEDKADKVIRLANKNKVEAKIVGEVIPGRGKPHTCLFKDGVMTQFRSYG